MVRRLEPWRQRIVSISDIDVVHGPARRRPRSPARAPGPAPHAQHHPHREAPRLHAVQREPCAGAPAQAVRRSAAGARRTFALADALRRGARTTAAVRARQRGGALRRRADLLAGNARSCVLVRGYGFQRALDPAACRPPARAYGSAGRPRMLGGRRRRRATAAGSRGRSRVRDVVSRPRGGGHEEGRDG